MDSQLLEQIVRQVIAALNAQTPASPPPPTSATPGTAPTPSASASAPAKASAPAGKKTVLTAPMLLQRAKAVTDGVLELADNEFLTPSAADEVSRLKLMIRRSGGRTGRPPDVSRRPLTTSPPASAGPAGPTVTGGIGLVVRRADTKVETALAALAREGVALAEEARSDCWLVNLRTMAEAVASGALAGGVVLTTWPAEAVMIANKVAGVRAIGADRPDALGRSLRSMAPNVLVVDPSAATFHELRSLVRLFATSVASGRAVGDAALSSVLKGLERK